jgi:folate-binding protein YgfZ
VATELASRGIVRVAGEEARAFLERLITCDMDRVAADGARLGALLSPQGKILADFIVAQVGESEFLLDCPAACVGDLIRRLTLYKLRAKLTIADLSATHVVVAGWDGAGMPDGAVRDPRLAELGWRWIRPREASAVGPEGQGESAYHTHRVRLGVPEAGLDFALGDAFPHEALMDQLGGVDFDKGCYVGQEVVSRMQHRGTARTRVVSVVYDGHAPTSGAEVTAGDRVLGRTGSASGDQGLAMIRIDRATDALESGTTILAGDRLVRFTKPGWVRFPYPGEAAPAA